MNTALSTSERFRLTSRSLTVLVPVLLSILFVFFLLLEEWQLALYASYVYIPSLVAAFLSLRGKQEAFHPFPDAGRNTFLSLVSIFFLSIASAVSYLHFTDYRTVGFFAITTVGGTSILLQILTCTRSPKQRIAILVQLALFLEVLIFSLSLQQWYYVGGSDLLHHVSVIREFTETGSLPSTSVYESFPLWHYLVAKVAIITDFPVQLHRLTIITSGLTFASIPFLTYAVAKSVTQSTKTRLFAAFFVSLNISVVYYGAYSISRSIVLVLLLPLIYMIYRDNSRRLYLLYAIVVAALVLFHPSSPPFILLLIGLVYLVKVGYGMSVSGRQSPFQITKFGVLLFATVFYWVFFAESIVQALAITLFGLSSQQGAGSFSTATTTLGEAVSQLYNYVPYSILFGLILTAAFISLRSDRLGRTEKAVVVIGLVSAGVTFPNPLLLIDTFSSFNFSRWGIYTPVFVGTASATGLVTLYNRTRSLSRILVVVLLVSLIFTSVTNPQIAADNPQLAGDRQNPYLTQEETAALEYGIEHSSGDVISDYLATRYVPADRGQILILDPQSKTPVTGDRPHVLILRHDELSTRGIQAYPSEEYLYRPWVGRVEVTDSVRIPAKEYHVVYSSTTARGYSENS